MALKAGCRGQWTAEDLEVAQEFTNRLPKDAEKDPVPPPGIYAV